MLAYKHAEIAACAAAVCKVRTLFFISIRPSLAGPDLRIIFVFFPPDTDIFHVGRSAASRVPHTIYDVRPTPIIFVRGGLQPQGEVCSRDESIFLFENRERKEDMVPRQGIANPASASHVLVSEATGERVSESR